MSTSSAVITAISSLRANVICAVLMGAILEVVVEVVAVLFFDFELHNASSLSMRRLHCEGV